MARTCAQRGMNNGLTTLNNGTIRTYSGHGTRTFTLQSAAVRRKTPVLVKSTNGKMSFSSLSGKHFLHIKDNFKDETASKLITHVPDIVIKQGLQKKIPYTRPMFGVLMFVDVSGFTALCEKYGMEAKKGCGSDALTKTLNEYMGAIVENILDSNGDVIKFAGDAILSFWETTTKTALNGLVSALKCGMKIQKKCDNWDTEVGVKLRVKIGVAVGPLYATFIGNKDSQQFVMSGPCINNVRDAENAASAGLLVLSPKTWKVCPDKKRMTYALMRDSEHVKVLNITKDWGKEYDPSKSKVVSAVSYFTKKSNSNFNNALPRKRQHIDTIVRKGMLEPYVAAPVINKIEENQPLEYLCELRQVSIVFINLTLTSVPKEVECFILQDAFDAINETVVQFQGCLNKVFMFDKGCTFLVIFGLPGYKHENECAHALQCSHRIRERIESIDKIIRASIGVTTGNVFCGVVGHPDRHEYTVIGRKANMAARLMMHYAGIISCDEATYELSKLGLPCFKLLPSKEMKGLRQAGPIRQYLEDNHCSIEKMIQPSDSKFPLLGYTNEMAQFTSALNLITEHREKSHRRLVVFEGEAGVGKSRVLQAATDLATQQGHRVVSCPLYLNDSTNPYYTVKRLLKTLFSMDGCSTHIEREEALYKCSDGITGYLCLLNDLLGLQITCDEELTHMSTSKRDLEMRKLLNQIIHQFANKTCLIFAIDDAHFMDNESWEFLTDLASDSKAVCVLAMRPCPTNKEQCPAATVALNNEYTLRIKLKGLEPQFMGPLACQFLDCVKVAEELLRILETRSHGLPSWVEALVNDLMATNKIHVVHNQEGHNVCIVTPGLKLHMLPIPASLSGMILAKIDRLSATERMVIKCASVIGMSMEKDTLLRILPNANAKKFESSLAILSKAALLDVSFSSDSFKETLRFRTAIVQECAYSTLLESQRKKLHGKVANYLDENFINSQRDDQGTGYKPLSFFKKMKFNKSRGTPSKLSCSPSTTSLITEKSEEEELVTVYPQLIRHWRAAGSNSKTRHYLIKAGSIAISTGHNMQAISYLAQAKNLNPSREQLAYIDDLLNLALNWSLRTFTDNVKGRDTRWKGALKTVVRSRRGKAVLNHPDLYDDDGVVARRSCRCFYVIFMMLLFAAAAGFSIFYWELHHQL